MQTPVIESSSLTKMSKVNAPISQRTRFVPNEAKDEVRKTLAFTSCNDSTISGKRNINTTDYENSKRFCGQDESSVIILDTTPEISGIARLEDSVLEPSGTVLAGNVNDDKLVIDDDNLPGTQPLCTSTPNRPCPKEVIEDTPDKVKDSDLVNMDLNVVLGNEKRIITRKNSNKEIYVDVGEYNYDPRSNSFIQIKGISMPLARYAVLYDNYNKIERAIKELLQSKDIAIKIHLGSNYYATVNSPYKGVHLREWFKAKNSSELRPGKGVFLKISEWNELVKVHESLPTIIPEIETVDRCWATHYAQMDAIMCPECNPNHDYIM